ncbi:MAG: hypothetical protein HON94_13340 [Methylococcales bacterium]|nr:hypothetical protein [Methylococcales bacterium]
MFIAILFVSYECLAEKTWYMTASVNALVGEYSESQFKNGVTATGLTLSADYLERMSFLVALNGNNIDFKPFFSDFEKSLDQRVEADIKQSSVATKFTYNYFTNSSGKIMSQIAYHTVSNDDLTKNTHDVTVIAPRFSYQTFDDSLLMSLDVSQSSYPNDISVTQLVPSLGVAFNSGFDWLDLKLVAVKLSDAITTSNNNSSDVISTATYNAFTLNSSSQYTASGSFSKNASTTIFENKEALALDLKWIHWFGNDSLLNVSSLHVGYMLGEKMFAVDNDAMSVSNLADLQVSNFSVALTWKIKRDYEVMLLWGQSVYKIPV